MKGKTMNHNQYDTTPNLYDKDMLTDKKTYFLALEVEPMEVGRAYEQLPMYCTIMPRFHTALSVDELASALEPIFANFGPITLNAGEHLAFGPQKQLVTLVDPTEEITEIHQALFDTFNKLNVQYAEQEWVGEGYIPHVTDNQGKRLTIHQTLLSKKAYLVTVDHPLAGKQRKVKQLFKL